MEYKKITAGFFFTELNFCIYNLSNKKTDKVPYSLLLTENMIKRGIPTKLSFYLKHSLGKYYSSEELERSYSPCFISNHKQTWTQKTILGNGNNPTDNPATLFFNNLQNDLGEYGFVTNLTIPEYEIAEHCPDLKKLKELNPKTRVDFFIPESNLIIEIDGKQHNENLDKIRDNLFDKYNIKTIRISTHSIRSRDNDYFLKINEIKNELKLQDRINDYKDSFLNKTYEKENLVFVCTAIIRFQIFIIELIKVGKLNLNDYEWSFNINADFKCQFDWSTLAVEDFFQWFLPFSKICDEKFNKPNVNITYSDGTNSKDAIHLDMKLFQRPDETISKNYMIKSYYLDYFKLKKEHRSYLDFNFHLPILSKNKKIENILEKHKFENLKLILFQMFGYTSFNEGQSYIIDNVLKQENTLGLLPTGGGKSLCFQIPSIFQLGCSIVVCPIIALMNDHVDELSRYGFLNRCEFVYGEQTQVQKNIVYDKVRKGEIKFLFISPERFQNDKFRDLVIDLTKNNLISYIVIDEVHCLSEWGHDFRPSYLALANTIVTILKTNVPIISLTATASNNVLENIKIELNIRKENVIFRMHNSRPELNYNIIKTPDKDHNLDLTINKMINDHNLSDISAGIVFTMHVNGELGCFDVEQKIRNKFPGIKSGIFCGSIPNDWTPRLEEESFNNYKRRIQNEYKNNDVQLMCATKSFGMGINKKNIRFSLHYGMPSSMEALYQETGRTGRDKKEAQNIILFKDEKERIPDRIFFKNSDINTLKHYRDEGKKIEKGDFKNQLFLLTNNKKTVDDELNDVLNLLHTLTIQNVSPLELHAKNELNLYRLFQLGIIKDWLVTDYFQNTYKIYYENLNDKILAENIFQHIKNYEKSEPELEKHKNKINSIFKLKKDDQRKNIIRYLLQWNNDHFLYNRRQSLKTLYDYTKDFEITGPKEFKRKIEAYFKSNDETHNIEKYIESNYLEAPNNLNDLLVKDGKLIPIEKIQEITFILARFLESYQSNPWLNLLSSICRLITKTFDDPDGRNRLNDFIDEAKKNSLIWNKTLINLLKFAKIFNHDQKNVLSEAIGIHLDNSKELILLHKYLQDDYSAITYLQLFNKRLQKVF